MTSRDEIRRIFLDVVQRPAAERGAALAESCGSDADLRREVEALLAADESGFLDRAATELIGLESADAVRLEREQGSDEWLEFLARLESRRGSESSLQSVEAVGSGGMGTVLRVYDEDLRRYLAKKVISRDADDDSSHARKLGRFLEEAQVTAQLDHPGIVPVHELGVDDDGRVFFTMKLVRGRDLREIFDDARGERHGWTRARVVSVILRACEAVAFAHQKGVIHRDLKPANIMVGRYGETYVMDWGLARIIGEPDRKDIRLKATATASAVSSERQDRDESGDATLETLDGDVVGTPAYMAPEQAAGRLDEIGPHSDVYAMGSILYHLLSGHAPYLPPGTQASQYTVLRFLLDGPPTPLSTVAADAPPELAAICDKAMSRDHHERYATMEELADDLRAFVEGRVVKAYAVGAAEEFKKWVARNQLVAATAAGSLLLIATLVGFFVLQLRQSERRANENSEEAIENRRVAVESQRRTQAVLDSFLVAQLRDRVDTLWPIHPATAPAMEEWLAEADELTGRRSDHEALRSELIASGSVDAEEAWRLERLISDLDVLASGPTEAPSIRRVRQRMELARSLPHRTIEEHRDRWSEAVDDIADPVSSPWYDGLLIEPQLGLIPIGRDPESGCWEFLHVLSGELPKRNDDGRLEVDAATGLVLVLIPGGTYTIGAQADDEDQPHYDEHAAEYEGPTHEVTLEPFFVSKYEATQAQWIEITGANPSNYLGPTLPVEHVSWEMASQWLARVDLALPTEAQWEVAARAGVDAPWICGHDHAELDKFANLADASAPTLPGWKYDRDLDDGFASTSPVGSLSPNRFGLHDVLGNLFEWCRDPYEGSAYEKPATTPDGERDVTSKYRCYRGGSFGETPASSRLSDRGFAVPNAQSVFVGVRPARRLDG